jgi:5'-AMP-activated protein kinase beta subunit, interaction domain/Glycogen recognition site of AMP-activated protein kinase
MLTPAVSASKDGLSAIIQLPPGTHHIKFIVDGEMRTSDDLPTAVDYANILVNYLEVSADDIPPDEPSKPVSVPDSSHPGAYVAHGPAPALDSKTQEGGADPTKDPLHSTKPSAQPPPAPPRKYTREIPKYLLDYDLPEDSPEYLRSAAAISNLPPPPSLPMFLSKVILNGTTPMKDDSSVLNIPNHVVLNHLATSSIKNNVLAVSATTRYKRKVTPPLVL